MDRGAGLNTISDKIDLTIERKTAQELIDHIRSLRVPGYRLEGFMVKLTKKLEKNA